MKKSLILLPLAAVLLTLTGCKKNNEKSVTPGETVTFTANIGGGEKTEIYNGTKMKWSDGDKITINGDVFTSSFSSGNYNMAKFSGTFTDMPSSYEAYYPETLNWKNLGKYYLPVAQNYNVENGNILSGIDPMYAYQGDVNDKTLHFYHICALVKLQVKGEGMVKTIVVSSDDLLCGQFQVIHDSGNDRYYAKVDPSGYKKLILDCGTGVELNNETPKTFYIALPQGELKNLTFTFRGVNGGKWESEPIAAANLIAGKIYTKSLEKGTYKYPPVGCLPGEFSVSETKKIYFSNGNLQFHTTNKKWRFAENQYDLLDANTSEHETSDYAENSDKWIDLFGWGTSGQNHGATSYQPWSTSEENSDYYAYSDVNKGLYDNDGSADWGYSYCAQQGVATGTWRVLTNEEWDYLRSRNTTYYYHGCYLGAKVNGVCGILLFPDVFSWPLAAGVEPDISDINNINHYGYECEGSVFTALQDAGCVFLPAAGSRLGFYVSDVGSIGYYWNSSNNDGYFVGSTMFNTATLNFTYDEREYGSSVRLVYPFED